MQLEAYLNFMELWEYNIIIFLV